MKNIDKLAETVNDLLSKLEPAGIEGFGLLVAMRQDQALFSMVFNLLFIALLVTGVIYLLKVRARTADKSEDLAIVLMCGVIFCLFLIALSSCGIKSWIIAYLNPAASVLNDFIKSGG